jgi:UPF0716 family protein affecting phage T7 exclusion
MRVDEPGRLRGREPVFKAGGVPFLAIAYIVGEFLVFGMVSDRVGFFFAFLLAIGKSVLGFMILGAFMRHLLAQIARTGGGVFRLPQGGIGLRLLGALFLVLPGFLSAVIALVLLVPGLRDMFRPAARRPPDGVIELTEAEWREVEDDKRDPSRRLRKPRR